MPTPRVCFFLPHPLRGLGAHDACFSFFGFSFSFLSLFFLFLPSPRSCYRKPSFLPQGSNLFSTRPSFLRRGRALRSSPNHHFLSGNQLFSAQPSFLPRGSNSHASPNPHFFPWEATFSSQPPLFPGDAPFAHRPTLISSTGAILTNCKTSFVIY